MNTAIWVIAGSMVLMSLCALVCATVSVFALLHGRRSKRRSYGARTAAAASAVHEDAVVSAKYNRAREFIAFKTGGGDDE